MKSNTGTRKGLRVTEYKNYLHYKINENVQEF